MAGRDAGRRGTPGRRAWLALGGVVALLAVAWVGLYVAAGSGIARGTTVLGVDIGGRSPGEAAALLDRALHDRSVAAVPVRAAGVSARVHPAQAGLSLDAAATVAAAEARSWDPRHLLRSLRGGNSVAPVVHVDRAALAAAVDRLAHRVDRPAVEGTVRVTPAGGVRPVQPVPGRTLRRAAAADAVAAAYLVVPHAQGGAPVELPVRVAQPRVTRAEVARAVREVATPALSAPVALSVDGRPVAVPPAAVARALTFAPDGDGRLQPSLDGARLHAALAGQLAAVETPAVDASFRIVAGRPTVVPSRPGREVQPAALAAAVLPALTSTGPDRAATVSVQPSEPAVSTATAQGLGVTELVSSYTTYYPSDFPPRLQNIHRAADLMDRTLVLPGKVFSLNDVVGERTKARGFAAGFIIDNGKLEVDFGGGVSQLATTTFNAAYFAGLDLVEHHAHSFYISRYPEGRDATVAWGFKDLRFRNDSPHGIFVTTSYTNSSITVRLYGTKRYRVESVKGPRTDVKPFHVVHDPRPAGTTPGTCVATAGVPGFRVVVTRRLLQGGTQVRTDQLRTAYAPENEVRCAGA